MCGIYCVMNEKTNQAAQSVLEGLKKLEYRGYDSWGIALVSLYSKNIQLEKHIGKIGEAGTKLSNGSIAMGHTRWATHGGVTDENAHPHLDCKRHIAVIHNGIVENYQELKNSLTKKHHFVSQTDTEVISHLIEEERDKTNLVQAVLNVFKKLEGSNAICVLDYNEKSIITCRNGSPIVLGIKEKESFVASDVTPILKYTKDIYYVKDGEAVVQTENGVFLYDIESQQKKTYSLEHITWSSEDAEKNGYPHFLLKEIMEQKNTLNKAVATDMKVFHEIAKKIKDGYKIVVTGCGTAFYCALSAKYFFAQVGIDISVYGAYEFIPFARFCDKKTLFIAISQSGETADTLIATRKAQEKGSYIVSIINARGSTLERLSNGTISVGAGPEIAVVSTKAFTSQLTILYLISQFLKNQHIQAIQTVKKLSNTLETWLPKITPSILEVAKLLADRQDIYLIGKHTNYPAALEFALKIKETSYIHAEAFSSGELKHGVLTLIQKNTPCIVLSSNDETKNEVLSSAAELKARGGTIIGIAPFSSSEFNIHIKTPDVGELSLFPNVIVGQLLGYYLGVIRGTDPDKPRNLAKSVTVK